MTRAEAYKAALEAAAKVADGYHWVLPMYENEEMNIASDDAAESVCEQIAAAIRALPVPSFAITVWGGGGGSDGNYETHGDPPAPEDAGDMVMVPREPTPEMLEAASGHYLLASIYRAMIRAAGGKK